MQVSFKFISAVKLDKRRAYEIAWEAGVNPTTLSKLINGIERPRKKDHRILAVGKVLGLNADECFQETCQECRVG